MISLLCFHVFSVEMSPSDTHQVIFNGNHCRSRMGILRSPGGIPGDAWAGNPAEAHLGEARCVGECFLWSQDPGPGFWLETAPSIWGTPLASGLILHGPYCLACCKASTGGKANLLQDRTLYKKTWLWQWQPISFAVLHRLEASHRLHHAQGARTAQR